jgi:hypothetical protein
MKKSKEFCRAAYVLTAALLLGLAGPLCGQSGGLRQCGSLSAEPKDSFDYSTWAFPYAYCY